MIEKTITIFRNKKPKNLKFATFTALHMTNAHETLYKVKRLKMKIVDKKLDIYQISTEKK